MSSVVVNVDWNAVAKVREYELVEARNLQLAMVPAEPLRSHGVEVAKSFLPAAEVGGDFLDYFLLSDDKVGLYVGDVTGKGLPAALYASLVLGTLRGIHKTGMPPSEALELLNNRLRVRAIQARYCAVQYAVFDPATQALCYANAGLPGPLHISARGCCELLEGGLPSGMFDSVRYTLQSVQLHPGDAVLFFTDGLIEARNAQEEEFGLEQLQEICAQNHTAAAEALLVRISAAMDRFVGGTPQYDDMALAVLKLDHDSR